MPVPAAPTQVRWHPSTAPPATLATYTLGVGWATCVLVLPQGQAVGGLQIGALPTQTDVRNRWPDGSIKLAVITAKVLIAGAYAITASAAPLSGQPTPTPIAATVRLTIAGVTYDAPLPAPTANLGLDGPLVREWRALVTPGAHPTLQVVYDVRSYHGGGHRIDVCVQNVRDVVAMDKGVYDLTLTVNGQIIHTRTGFTHYSFERVRHYVGAVDGLVESSVLPDFEPFYRAGVLPRYLSTVNNASYNTSGSAWLPGGFGNMQPSMVQGGGRPDIAPFPWWQAQYLVHKSASQRAATLKNGDNSGSWSLHITKPDGVSLVKVTEVPGYWFDPAHRYGNTGGANGPMVPRRPDTWMRGIRMGGPTYSDVDAKTDAEHVPSLTYLPYLMTGDRYYLDQCKLWGAWALLQAAPGGPYVPEPKFLPQYDRGRKGTKGLMWVSGMGREFGWPLRLVVQAAIVAPDADPDRAYFLQLAQSNITAVSEYMALTPVSSGPVVVQNWGLPTPLVGWEGNSTPDGSTVPSTGKVISVWRLSYTAWVLHFADAQRLWTLGRASEFIERVITIQSGLILNVADVQGKMPYYPAVARVTNNGNTLTFMPDWTALYADNKGTSGYVFSPGSPAGWWAYPAAPTGYYNTEAWVLLTMGLARGLPNAQSAYDWVRTYPGSLGDINSRSGFALAQEQP